MTEPEEEIVLRTKEEVGHRIVCLFCYVGTAFERDDPTYIDYLVTHNFWQHLSPTEEAYLTAPSYGTQANIDATWKYEALYLLSWAVGIVPSIEIPTELSPTQPVVEAFPNQDQSPTNFLNALTLRSISQIMEASDLIYRLHWATRQYGSQIDVEGGVIQEWHQAINWLTNYDREDWDQVTTDT